MTDNCESFTSIVADPPANAAVSGDDAAGPRLVARGRSGAVFLDQDPAGTPLARKVFLGEEGLSRLVLYVTTGAANPYGWNRDAVRTAILRRQMLEILVPYWFDGQLRLPRTEGAAWNSHHQAFEIRTEFIQGHHLPLRWSASDGPNNQHRQLTRQIMRPLQSHLMESGFDGMLWQAGLGNPVAGGNFMLEDQGRGRAAWTWVDLESGVPALFPLNPLALFRFYLPRSIRHRCCLFDDVDTSRLREYLEEHFERLAASQGAERATELLELADQLERHQQAWKKLSRTERSIQSYLATGRITDSAASWYRTRPWRWQARLLSTGACRCGMRARAAAGRLGQWLIGPEPRRIVRQTGRFIVSGRYRQHVARRYGASRVRDWRARRFISSGDARLLKNQLARDQSQLCLIDFGVHMAIKPLMKVLQWWVFPALYLLGAISEPMLALMLVSGGALGRTTYTGLRCVQSGFRGQRQPWAALGVGLLPVVGNVAFPIQAVIWSREQGQRLSQFLLYDACAGIGRRVPIWGGSNSLVEAWANRLPDVILPRCHQQAQENFASEDRRPNQDSDARC